MSCRRRKESEDETPVAARQIKTLASLLTKAGLADMLATGGPFTVFAPTDEVFAKVPKATLDALAEDPAQLKSVLLYHVVSGRVATADVVKLSSAKTLECRSLPIKVFDGSVFVDQAKVTDRPTAGGRPGERSSASPRSDSR